MWLRGLPQLLGPPGWDGASCCSQGRCWCLQLLGDDLDPSPFSKGSTGVLWLFPSSQEMNHCKSSSLLLAKPFSGSSRRCSLPRTGRSGQHSSHPCVPGRARSSLILIWVTPHLTRDLWSRPWPSRAGSQVLPLLPACGCVF